MVYVTRKSDGGELLTMFEPHGHLPAVTMLFLCQQQVDRTLGHEVVGSFALAKLLALTSAWQPAKPPSRLQQSID
jgi:hypothetical protein